jgi:hypothetical protein
MGVYMTKQEFNEAKKNNKQIVVMKQRDGQQPKVYNIDFANWMDKFEDAQKEFAKYIRETYDDNCNLQHWTEEHFEQDNTLDKSFFTENGYYGIRRNGLELFASDEEIENNDLTLRDDVYSYFVETVETIEKE